MATKQPKGKATKGSGRGAAKGRTTPSSKRYTPPTPKAVKRSPMWVPVLMFALLLADRLDVDVAKAITDKLAANERKYPVALARGNARKYTQLHEP